MKALIFRSAGAAAVALLAVVSIAGCGNDSGSDSGEAETATVVRASASSFPRPSHRSLREFVADMQQGPELAPSVSLLSKGKNRFGFGLFDDGNRQVGDLEAAIYYARGVDETVRGPFPATYSQIEVKPAFRSKTTSEDEDSAKAIYVTEVDFPQAGNYLVLAVSRLGNQMVATSPAQVQVSANSRVPNVGDHAVRVHTPTVADVHGDLEKIDTRVPPSKMHDVDLADSLDNGRPAILLFATPALCQSRVCGPVTDVAEQVKDEHGDEVDFIHSEVFEDNNPSKGVNRQMKAWRLETEPVAFAIDSNGRIVDRLEGAFTVAELEAAVRKAQG